MMNFIKGGTPQRSYIRSLILISEVFRFFALLLKKNQLAVGSDLCVVSSNSLPFFMCNLCGGRLLLLMPKTMEDLCLRMN
jgi:hypothetical protein